MTKREEMCKVAEVAVAWLSEQINDTDAIDKILDILLPDTPVTFHAVTDDDVEERISELFDEEPYEQTNFFVPEV